MLCRIGDISMNDAASMIAQVKSGTSPPDWRIYEAKLSPLFVMILGNFFGILMLFFLGLFLLFVAQGLFSLFIPHLFPLFDIRWGLLGILLLTIVYTPYQVIRKRTRRGFLILTDQEVVEYIPYYRFRPIHVLAFAEIQGMAIQTLEGEPDRGQRVTSYCLAIRNAQGKEQTWELAYGSYGLITEIYHDIIERFERCHANKTDGLKTYRRYLIYD